MNFTLRQAHKMVEKINGRMTKINIQPQREVAIWSIEADTIGLLHAEFEAELQRQIALTGVRQALRSGIQQANRAEVDGLVAERKATLDRIGILRNIVSSVNEEHMYSPQALDAKVAAAKQAAGNGASIYRSDAVTVAVVTAERLEQLNKMIDEFQLKLESIEDQLTAANADRTNLVTITEEDAEVLRQESLVA